MEAELSVKDSGEMKHPVGINDLPPELLDIIVSFLTYETASNVRLVSRAMDRVCRRRLNQGFARAERFVSSSLKSLRTVLPRRESERREHPLSRRVEHLIAVETRLGLLGMTYRRYIELDQCCFIPGKVLDEIFWVVNYLKTAPHVERSSFSLLQELRDISSMAMEHFEEHIVPSLRRAERRPRLLSLVGWLGAARDDGPSSSSSSSGLGHWGPMPPVLSSLLPGTGDRNHGRSSGLGTLEQTVNKLAQQLSAEKARVKTHSQQLAELRQTISDQAEKLVAQDLLIADLSSKLGRVEERLRVVTGGEPSEQSQAESNSSACTTSGAQHDNGKTATEQPAATQKTRKRRHPPTTGTAGCAKTADKRPKQS